MLAHRPCPRRISLLAALTLLLLSSVLGRAGTPPASVLYVDATLGVDVFSFEACGTGIDVTSPAGWLELFAAGFAPADIPLGGLGSLLVDPVGLTILTRGALSVPSQSALHGLELYLQAAGIDPSTTAGALSRCATIELH